MLHLHLHLTIPIPTTTTTISTHYTHHTSLYPLCSMGELGAFFFTTPVAQPGSSLWNMLSAKADWESPALSPSNMCKNWCDDECTWETSWSTMHIFLKADFKDVTCPGAKDPILGMSCQGVE